jgi:ribosomal protein S18 acetylase RimI-like enzyme
MELVKHDFVGYKKDEFRKAVRDAAASKEAFIAYEGGEISGLVVFSLRLHEITFLAVPPVFRKRGIAKSLIDDVKRCFRPGETLQVVTFRSDDPMGKAAVACYLSCGFSATEKLEVHGYPCQKMTVTL